MDEFKNMGTTSETNLVSQFLDKQESKMEREGEPGPSSVDGGGNQSSSETWTHLTFPKIKEEIEIDSYSSDDDLEINRLGNSGTSLPFTFPKLKEEMDEPQVFGAPEQDKPEIFTHDNLILKSVNTRDINDYQPQRSSDVQLTLNKNELFLENNCLEITKKYYETQGEAFASTYQTTSGQQCVNNRELGCDTKQRKALIYKCDVCGECFSTNSKFSDHRKEHSVDRIHKCDVCSKYFKYRSNLTKHMSAHCNAKEYKCALCGESFKHFFLLNEHRLSHLERETYDCDICGKSFKQRYRFSKHKLLHNKDVS